MKGQIGVKKTTTYINMDMVYDEVYTYIRVVYMYIYM